MIKPIASHTKSLNQLSTGNENIKIRLKRTPNIGRVIPKGTLKGLWILGSLYLNTIIATEIITKANSVPMLTSSDKILKGKNPAKIDTIKPVNIVDL